MAQAPGWSFRRYGQDSSNGVVQQSGYGNVPTSIIVTLPTVRQVNDLLFLTIAHKGTGFATLSADWTLAGREVSGPVRGEVYYRRCTGTEPANYTISGVSTPVVAGIIPYAGGALTDPIFDVISIGSWPAGLPPGTQTLAPAITTLQPWSLLLGFVAVEAAGEVGFPMSTPDLWGDVSCQRMVMRRETYTNYDNTAATKIHYVVWDILKHQPGLIGPMTRGGPFAGAGVGFLLAFRPDITASTPGTRYYLTARHPPHFPHGFWPAGVWDTVEGPRVDVMEDTALLSQRKSGAGRRYTQELTTNHTPSNQGFGRWMSPPLAAQTIAGTLQFTGMIMPEYATSGAPVVTGQIRIHAYVTVGQTPTIRGTLIAPYTNPEVIPDYPQLVRQLQAPLALTPVVCQEGDAIVVEIGLHVEANGPWPIPSRPQPNYWAILNLNRGTGDSLGHHTGVGAFDADLSLNSGSVYDPAASVSHLDFSQTIVELPHTPNPPPNPTWETAIELTGDAAHGPVNTADHTLPGCPVWYKWTSDRAGRLMLHTWGTTGSVVIKVYADPTDARTRMWGLYAKDKTVFTSLSAWGEDVTAGQVLYVEVSLNPDTRFAPEDGRTVYISFAYTRPLAHNDVILPCSGLIARYTKDGVLADLTTNWANYVVSGCAIDYTRRPMYDFNADNMHTGERLFIALYSYDGLTEVLDLEDLNYSGSEMAYWWPAGDTGGPAYYNGGASLAMTRAGLVICSFFGNGFTRVAGNFAAYQYEPAIDGSADFAIIDALSFFDQVNEGPSELRVSPTLDVGGTSYAELSVDETELFYTSGPWYIAPPMPGGQTIFRVSTETWTQLPPFATVPPPLAPGPLMSPGLKGLFPLPDGGCLVCNGNEVVRLDADGALVQRYSPTPQTRAQSLADVELGDDGFFWVLDESSSTLFKFNLETGEQVIDLWTKLGSGSSTSFVIYRRSLVPPEPTPECEVTSTADFPIGEED